MKNLLKNKTLVEFIGKMPTVKQLFFTALGSALLGFLFLSLLSYNLNDPAWSHVNTTSTTTNIMGRLGAWISDILRVFFGLGAWWIIVVLCFELIRLWWKHRTVIWQLRAISYAFLLGIVSGLLAQWGATKDDATALYFGGVVGYELHDGLVALFGMALTTLFLCGLILIVSVLTLNLSLPLPKSLTNKASPEPQPDNSTKEPPSLISRITPKKPSSPPPATSSESLSDFLKNSGIRENLHTYRIFSAQDIGEEPAQEPTPTPADTPKVTDEPSPQAVEPKPTPPEPKAVERIIADSESPTTDKHYMDNHGVGVTTVHTNVKIQHQDTKPTPPKTTIPSSDIDNTAPVAKPTPIGGADIKNTASPVADLTQKTAIHTPPSPTHTPADEPSRFAPEAVDTPIHTPNEMADETDLSHPTQDSPTERPKSRAMSTLEHRLSLSAVPELSLLDPAPPKQVTYTSEELERLSELLEIKLQEFNISAKVVSAIVGPVVTRFEVALAAGVKVSRVTKVAQDLARSMSMASLRVIPVIAGKPYIGIEVPNRHREIIGLIELLQTADYQDPEAGISIAIGQDISGRAVIADLAKAPHMLVAGTTGSGKSVLVNSFLLSMLLKYTPDELKLVLIDPKQLELANYGDIPHLLTPVITDMTEATAVLNWCVAEMERRYKLIGGLKVRQLTEFNKKVMQAELSGESLFDPSWKASEHVGEHPPKLKPLPKIVVVADEFADMIMQLGKTAEEPIVRLAQKARAAGIHLILATQRPVASVVTGLIKSNVPSRVALRVNSAIDSRLIIEESGAENMLGHGDMMFLAPGKNTTERVHGAYVKDDEVNRVTDAWRERGTPDYIDLSNSYSFEGEGSDGGNSLSGGDEEDYNQAVAFFVESKKVSISSLQRKLFIGYNKAARLVDLMEERGVVSAPDNGGKRQLLI